MFGTNPIQAERDSYQEHSCSTHGRKKAHLMPSHSKIRYTYFLWWPEKKDFNQIQMLKNLRLWNMLTVQGATG